MRRRTRDGKDVVVALSAAAAAPAGGHGDAAAEVEVVGGAGELLDEGVVGAGEVEGLLLRVENRAGVRVDLGAPADRAANSGRGGQARGDGQAADGERVELRVAVAAVHRDGGEERRVRGGGSGCGRGSRGCGG